MASNTSVSSKGRLFLTSVFLYWLKDLEVFNDAEEPLTKAIFLWPKSMRYWVIGDSGRIPENKLYTCSPDTFNVSA